MMQFAELLSFTTLAFLTGSGIPKNVVAVADAKTFI